MLVKRIDTEHEKPIADSLHILEAQIPSPRAIGFTQGSRSAELIGYAGEFLHRADIAELGVSGFAVLVHQDVDAGPLLPGVHGHVVWNTHTVWPLVLPIVAGEFDSVFCAVLEIGFAPAFDKQLRNKLEIIVAH